MVIGRWVWLECIGVVSGWCCKEAYRFPHYYLSLLHLYYIALFATVSLLISSFFKNFSFLFKLFLFNIANAAQRTFEIIQKTRSDGHGAIIILTSTMTMSPVLRLRRIRY